MRLGSQIERVLRCLAERAAQNRGDLGHDAALSVERLLTQQRNRWSRRGTVIVATSTGGHLALLQGFPSANPTNEKGAPKRPVAVESGRAGYLVNAIPVMQNLVTVIAAVAFDETCTPIWSMFATSAAVNAVPSAGVS